MKKEYIEYLKNNLSKERLEEGLELLKRGVSPQYIVGNVDFYGHIIEVNENVLIPRFETELLVDKLIHYIKNYSFGDKELRILDIGTGSGCIAISLAKEFNCSVDASDISSEALEVAKRNAISNAANVNYICSDIFSNIDSRYNVIVSNPPYIREDEVIEDIVKDNEPYVALYAKDRGLYFYKEILKNASNYLYDKAIVAFEIGELQGEEIRNLIRKYFGDVRVVVEKDYSNRDRFVFVFFE